MTLPYPIITIGAWLGFDIRYGSQYTLHVIAPAADVDCQRYYCTATEPNPYIPVLSR
jgi:hypothetical protein